MKSALLAAALVASAGGTAFAGALPLEAADGTSDAGSQTEQAGGNYFLALDGRPVGPFDLDDIAFLIVSEKVTAQTPAWTAGMPGWRAAGEIGVIAELFATATAATAAGEVAADDETPPAPPVAEELPPPPPPPVAEPEIRYFIAVNGQTTGPFTKTEMAAKITAGELAAATLVWKKGMAHWTAAETVTEIAALMNDRPKTPPFDCTGYLAGMWEKASFVSGTNVTIRVLYEPGGQYNGIQQIPGYGGAPLTANFNGTWKASATGEKTCSITAEQQYPYGVSITTVIEAADQFLARDKTNGGEWRRLQ